MKAFIGLGNPGPEYANTKHNAGFWVINELARRWSVQFQPGKGSFVYTEATDKEVLLVKPTTGMNASGVAVKYVLQKWNIDLADLNVVVDDVDLPLGSMRLRLKGGDGCHRGMESVIYHLGHTGFPRLRFGVAAADHKRPAEKYVLKPFKKNDQPNADDMIQTVADAVESILNYGLQKTMNQFNKKTIKKDVNE